MCIIIPESIKYFFICSCLHGSIIYTLSIRWNCLSMGAGIDNAFKCASVTRQNATSLALSCKRFHSVNYLGFSYV